MSVGFPQDKNTIDQRAGSLALSFRNWTTEIANFKTFIDGETDADLAAIGYSPDEVEVLRAAVTDLSNLAKIAHGQATQAEANDFLFNALHLIGVN